MTNVRKNLLATIQTTGGDTALTLSIPAAPTLIVGVAASGLTLAARGGVAPYAYSLVGANPLPTGLSLNASTGAITGTPTVGGTFLFLAKVQDAASTSYTASFSLTVAAGFYSIDSPPPAEVGIAYRWQMRVYDVNGTLLTTGYSIVSGAPPTGVTMSAGGLFTGTPTVAGSARFTVRATSGGNSADFPMTLKVAPALTATTDVTTLPPSIVGQPYAGNVIPANGVPPYRCKVTAGANRPGLSISSAGKVTGKPTQLVTSGYTAPTVTVTDALGATTTVVVDVPVRAAAAALPAGQVVIGNTNGDGTSETIDFFSWFFGAGADGDLVFDGTNTFASTLATKSGSVYTIRRDVYAHDLAVSGSAKVNTNGYAIYCSGALDLSNAGVLALGNNESNDGAAGSGSTGGAGGAVSGGTLRPGAAGGTGGNGSSGLSSGGAGSIPTDPPIPANGGDTWATAGSGAGGNGSVGSGGAAGANTVIAGRAGCPLPFGQLIVAAAGIKGGAGGAGGGGGGGSGAALGGGGGGGGAGGGVIMICAREIITSASTPSGAIKALPGKGGAGAGTSDASLGAGGGGKGGGGGYIHIRYVKRTGTPVTDLIWADGGVGGAGGVNSANAARNGTAGDGGCGGRIEALSILDCSVLHETLTDPGTYSGTTPGAAGKARLTF